MALLSTNHKCTHPCLLLLRRKDVWSLLKMLLSSRRTQPQSIACEVWRLCFQDKLYNSDNLLFVVILFYVILLLIIHLWCLYMYETWFWHTYSYVFGFVLKTGCDRYPPTIQLPKSIFWRRIIYLYLTHTAKISWIRNSNGVPKRQTRKADSFSYRTIDQCSIYIS